MFDVTFERDTPTNGLSRIVIVMLNYGTFGVKLCVAGDFLGLHGFGLKKENFGSISFKPHLLFPMTKLPEYSTPCPSKPS